MKIGKFQVFPKKVKVTVGLKCGKTFYFYCDNMNWTESKGFTFDGAPAIRGTLRPTIDVGIASTEVSYVQHETVRLFHIYST